MVGPVFAPAVFVGHHYGGCGDGGGLGVGAGAAGGVEVHGVGHGEGGGWRVWVFGRAGVVMGWVGFVCGNALLMRIYLLLFWGDCSEQRAQLLEVS